MSATIKVIKRKNTDEAVAAVQTTAEPVKNTETVERHSRRELVSTVKNWVTEQRERNRTEDLEGLRRIFGDVTPILGAR